MSDTPLVSILVPTQDRRDFLPQLLRYIGTQTWPADRIEVCVVDDGRDPVADVFEGLPRVAYERLDTRVPIGTKRNHLLDLASGDVLVHMDDDDWYPPDRIERAVKALHDTGADVVGRSDIAFYDVETGGIHLMPAVGAKHARAGTMAYTRAYLEQARWAPDPHDEERQFLKCFAAKLAQLPGEPWETVLAIRHGHNLLPMHTSLPRLDVTLEQIIADPADRAFYADLDVEDDW